MTNQLPETAQAIVWLKDTETGEVAEIDKGQWDLRTFSYVWLQGNWSCDCNREIEFARAVGRELPEMDGPYCLGEGRYTLERVTFGGVDVVPDEHGEYFVGAGDEEHK